MSTKREKNPPAPKWKGDEVEDRPGGEAELAADRAEGKTAISLADALEPTDEPEPMPAPARGALTPDEKIAEVAEEHRARQAAEGRGPRGKL